MTANVAASEMISNTRGRQDRQPRKHSIGTVSARAAKAGTRARTSLARESGSIVVAIGARVREFRIRLNWTGIDLAEKAGLSPGMLSKIENGSVSASIESLESLARALNVPLTTFFAGHGDKRNCRYVPAGGGVTIEGQSPHERYELLGHSFRGDILVELYLVTLTEKVRPCVLFRSPGVEYIYMLTGTASYQHAGNTYILAPGDALLFDSVVLHGPKDLIDVPITYLLWRQTESGSATPVTVPPSMHSQRTEPDERPG